MAEHERERLTQVANAMHEHRTGLVLTGRIKDGKLELDQATKDEIARKFPKADKVFVAMNSPFAHCRSL